jgi:uncharacterized protein
MALVPMNTVELAHWIRYGLAFALPLSALAILLYPLLIRAPDREADGKMPDQTVATVLSAQRSGF